jgi:hypothetical protein
VVEITRENDRAYIAELLREIEMLRHRSDLGRDLVRLCGYVGNGTSTSVTISEDDATRWWAVNVGKRGFYGPTLREAVDAALLAVRHD